MFIVANLVSLKQSSSYFGIYRIVEQRKLRRVCANAQTRQSLCCSYTQRLDVYVDTNQILDFFPAGYVRIGVKQAFTHM